MNDQTKTVIRSVIAGCGSALPQRVMTNADMSKIVDTSDEWIVERTGIKQRHIADKSELTSDLAFKASQNLLENYKMKVEEKPAATVIIFTLFHL